MTIQKQMKRPRYGYRRAGVGVLLGLGVLLGVEPAGAIAMLPDLASKQAQQPILGQVPNPPLLAQQLPPPRELPSEPLPPLPDPDELLQAPPQTAPPPGLEPDDATVTLFVEGFEVVGSTVFSEEELAVVLEPYTNRELSLTELYEARTAITQLYLDEGYVLSGAFIPPQDPANNIVQIQVIEGRLEEIQVNGNERLRSHYIRTRLGLAAGPPLRLDDLVEQLRLLQLNPLIDNISAELSTGLEPGSGILIVEVDEADTFRVDFFTDNERSPTVGSWQRGVAVIQDNLTGLGDSIFVDYTNTEGSNEINAGYTIPINPRNGTISLGYGFTDSQVIEDPFDILDIDSESRYYDLTYRQPIFQTPSEEFALSLTASRQESRSLFLENLLGDPIPFPALGADEDGRIRVSALRFAQEWTRQGAENVVSLRSQLNVGLDAFDSTINDDAPDSRFVSWQGQAQWVNLLAEDTLFILRGELQLTGDSLVPLEQIGLGGRRTVRGYRQDLLLTDNGLLISAEVSIPVIRSQNSRVQIIPFFDVGTGWNVGSSVPTPDTNTILGTGLGLQWQQGDRFSARLDWGIPLTDIDADGDSLQEDGIYFSIRYSAF